MIALEHTGDPYSCDHFVEPAYKLGNVSQAHLLDLVASPQQAEFGRAKRDTVPRYCLDCDVRFACHGGCPKDRFATRPDGEPGLHNLCLSYKAFFGHIRPAMKVMCALLRAGRAPSGLVRRYTAADSRRPQRPVPVRVWPQVGVLPPAPARYRAAAVIRSSRPEASTDGQGQRGIAAASIGIAIGPEEGPGHPR